MWRLLTRIRATPFNPTDKPQCESKAPSYNRISATLVSEVKLLSRTRVKNKEEIARRACKEGMLAYASMPFTLAN